MKTNDVFYAETLEILGFIRYPCAMISHKNRIKKLFCIFLLFALSLGFAKQSAAGVIEIQPLQFGEYIVKNNDAVYSITVNVGGVTTFDPAGFIQIAATGQDGIYDITDLDPSRAISSVTLTQTTPLTAAANSFEMTAFTVSHPPSTDAGGVARIRVGATAQTLGNGVSYSDQTYIGRFDIQINY